MNEFARGLIQEFDVRTVNEIVPARALSGGNQQRRLLHGKSAVIRIF